MKNSKGLKGVTDATMFCKSMYGKGGSAGKSQIIRSMKSFDLGGTSGVTLDSNCTSDDGGGCHKGNRKANRSRLKDAGVGRKTRNRMY
jgi:hypothetical protein